MLKRSQLSAEPLQQIARVATMSDALLSSQAVFRSRAAEIGVDPAAVQTAIDESIGTLGQFGFATSFIPGIKKTKVFGFLWSSLGAKNCFLLSFRTGTARRDSTKRTRSIASWSR